MEICEGCVGKLRCENQMKIYSFACLAGYPIQSKTDSSFYYLFSDGNSKRGNKDFQLYVVSESLFFWLVMALNETRRSFLWRQSISEESSGYRGGLE